MISLPCVCTTRLSLSALLAALLVSSMKVCILEQISRGAMLTSEVTQEPRSIRPIDSENQIIKHLNLKKKNSYQLFDAIQIMEQACGNSN